MRTLENVPCVCQIKTGMQTNGPGVCQPRAKVGMRRRRRAAFGHRRGDEVMPTAHPADGNRLARYAFGNPKSLAAPRPCAGAGIHGLVYIAPNTSMSPMMVHDDLSGVHDARARLIVGMRLWKRETVGRDAD